MDEFAAVVKSWMQKAGGSARLVGKTYDLQKAYRQLGVSNLPSSTKEGRELANK